MTLGINAEVESIRREVATAQWRAANAIWQRELAKWRAMDQRKHSAEKAEIQRQKVAVTFTMARDAYEAINQQGTSPELGRALVKGRAV